MNQHRYFVYITTNPGKTVLYTGVTNDLITRMAQHFQNRGQGETFAGKYYCYRLIYFESYQFVREAIEREKEIKLMKREDKLNLIRSANPKLEFLVLR